MFAANDSAYAEYDALMSRSRSLERTGLLSWTIATCTAAMLLAWATSSRTPGPLVAAVIAVAAGFYPLLHARQQLRMIACYLEEFVERAGGPQWFTRVGRLQAVPAASAPTDWFHTITSNLVVVAAITFAWMFAGSPRHGELIAGVATAFGLMFIVHSVMETARVERTDYTGLWRKVTAGARGSAAA
jgi:hypothetical protein